MGSDHPTDSLPEFTDAVEILVVDDDEAWARGTARLLDQSVEAFVATTATSLSKAHELYAPREFDCVVCDHQLGDGTGLSLLETVRQREPDLPFVLVTGQGDEQLAGKAIRHGVTDYVTKAYDNGAELLVTCVGRAVDSYRTDQALERERRSKNALLELLTATSDETELCREFCSILTDRHGYASAWIGTKTDSGIVARAAVGDDGFLEAAIYDLPATAVDRDPAVEALETADPIVRQIPPEPVAEEGPWQTLAREHGFESAAGIPLDYDGIQFGVLGVYATGRPTIDSDRIESLSAFADTLGYALHTADFKRSLGSQSVTVEIEVSDSSVPLVDLECSLSEGSRLVVPSVVFGDASRTVYHVRLEGVSGAAVAEAVEATESVTFADGSQETATADGPIQCAIAVDGQTPEALLVDHGARLTRTVVEGATALLTVRLPDHRQVSTAADTLRAAYDGIVISSIRQDNHSASLGTVESLLEPMTEKQATALRHAYYEGFFHHPRETTATELAAQFEVTRQTLTHHIRAAERKLFAQLFDR